MEHVPGYLEVLNTEQRNAVLHEGKRLLILAGAGSGKTRVITTKIAWLIRECGAAPWSILAVTFTNKAAREMAARAARIDERASDAFMRTFHSFGAWFLRRNAELAGLDSSFVIYDDDDALSLLSSIRPDASRLELREIASLISRAKDYFLSPGDPELDRIDHRKNFRETYARYEERLQRIGNVDFGDLIKKPVEILRNNTELAEKIRRKFRVILVDEYQDSNVAQFALLRELTGEDTRLCVVGDDDQSIYRFRGAEVKNILEFPERFPGTDVVRLERNYRSFAPILALASSVVDHNIGRLGKTLRSERGEGRLPVLAFLPNQDEEAAFCAEIVRRSVKDGARYCDWAILYRTNAQSLGFETEFLRRRVPYRVVGSLKFYEREEVKDTLALLSLLVNPRDEVAFRRMVNKPSRGAGTASVDKIIAAFNGNYAELPAGTGILEAAKTLVLPPKARAGLTVFSGILDRGRELLDQEKSVRIKRAENVSGRSIKAGAGLSVCAASLVTDAGLDEYHGSHDEINGYQRIGNLQELVNAASLYPATREGLVNFLEHIELDRSIGEEKDGGDDRVTLITLHNTKGLEFPRVVLTGLEQGVFPRTDKAGEDLEEERRLFYVGATRAMDELYLCSCAVRRMYGRTQEMFPSPFLYEADSAALRVIGNAPAGFGSAENQPKSNPAPRAFQKNKTSSDGNWTLGQRVFNDDQGYGFVSGFDETEDGPLVLVRFENGRETRFLSPAQNAKFLKIGGDV